MTLVLADGLEEAGKQGGADNLVFQGLGVCQTHGSLAVVLAVQPGKVLIVAAENEGQDFAPAGHGGFESDNVGQLVDHEGGTDGGTSCRGSARQLVETITDRQVLHNITLMQDIGTRGRDGDFEQVGILV